MRPSAAEIYLKPGPALLSRMFEAQKVALRSMKRGLLRRELELQQKESRIHILQSQLHEAQSQITDVEQGHKMKLQEMSEMLDKEFQERLKKREREMSALVCNHNEAILGSVEEMRGLREQEHQAQERAADIHRREKTVQEIVAVTTELLAHMASGLDQGFLGMGLFLMSMG